MPFDAGSIVARLKLNSQEFKTGLQSGLADAKKFDRAMGAVFKGGLFVTGIAFASKQVYNLANNAARLDTLTQAFERMAGGAENANKILMQSQGVTRALAERDLKAAATQLELLGIGMENLPRFVEIARSAAIGLGQDVGYMLQSLSTGTARQSRLWLDNLGIIISVEEANEAYAKSLGKTAKELTDNEQRAAFLFSVMDKGQDIIDKVGASSETSAEQVQSLGAAFKDLGDSIGELALKLKLPGIMSLLAMGIRGQVPFLTPFGVFGGGFNGPQQHGAGPREDMPMGRRTPSGLADQVFRDQMRALGGTPAANGPRREGFNSFIGLDWAEVEERTLTMGSTFQQTFDLIGSGLSTLGDSFAGFFEMLVTDSSNAGRAFFAGIMGGLSGIASNLGDFFIQMGIGTLAIKTLNPFAAIAAGMALKALSGIMRGIAFNNAPVTGPGGFGRSVRNPLATGNELQGSTTIVVEGDFIGDRVWIDRLIDKIRLSQRNRGTTVVFAG